VPSRASGWIVFDRSTFKLLVNLCGLCPLIVHLAHPRGDSPHRTPHAHRQEQQQQCTPSLAGACSDALSCSTTGMLLCPPCMFSHHTPVLYVCPLLLLSGKSTQRHGVLSTWACIDAHFCFHTGPHTPFLFQSLGFVVSSLSRASRLAVLPRFGGAGSFGCWV
jgi:hypothetical protein